MNDLEKICADAYEARVKIGTLDTDIKNKVLKKSLRQTKGMWPQQRKI